MIDDLRHGLLLSRLTEAQLADDFSDLEIVRNERVVRRSVHGDALDVVLVAVKGED